FHEKRQFLVFDKYYFSAHAEQSENFTSGGANQAISIVAIACYRKNSAMEHKFIAFQNGRPGRPAERTQQCRACPLSHINTAFF
ncbi:MAG: hypothetical protein LBO82_06925, partial [Synergistaceae bacterium]|nr:hypothetical protein [Synergistaceae bacterium]